MQRTNRAFAILILTLSTIARADAPAVGDVTQPTLVTVNLENAQPKTVFDDIASQASLEFLTLPPKLWETSPGSPMSVSVNNQPFWVAMKDACGKAGISLKYATDTATPRIILSRDNQDWTAYPTVATGPFLVSLIGLHRATTVDMRKPAEFQKIFYAKFTIFCEPRFRLLRGSLNAKIDQATDDKGNALVPKDAAEQPPMNFITTWVYNLDGKLDYPKEPGTRIATLRASAKFVAQTQSQTIEYADPLTSKNVTKIVAGRKIIVKDVHRAADEYEATVTFVRGEIPQAQWEQTVFPGNSLRLVDGDGKILLAHGFGMGGRGDESTFVFKFDKDPKGARIGKPLKLAWEIPTQTKEIPLSFEFKDLPLP